ncbi:MAG: hypothetical protein MUF62_05440 [Chitinophagaceae bacterium]|jgi:outer membrane murein-binding lipoprotein Lpp|nr:hypothetical protein [Chitinophagaceae bacterium]
MKKMILSLLLAGGLALAGCSSEAEKAKASADAQVASLGDSLYKQVMDLHDEAMPKMGKLKGLQAAAQAQIDSLTKLKKADLQPLIDKLTALKTQLAEAEKGMDDWMTQLDIEKVNAAVDEKARYFTDQKAKAQKMRDDIFAALDSAATVIKQ